MPQPLSRIAPNAGVLLGNAGDRPISRHPELAVLAIEAIASWGNVEAFLLRLFICLFGGVESVASEVFLALGNQSAKTAAINVAAESVLQNRDDERKILKALIAISKTHEKSRNKLAHWIWGDSPQLPDALLLVDPRLSIEHPDTSKIYVYKADDFNKIISDNDKLCGFGLKLRFILEKHPANWNGELVSELLSEPEIASRIE